MKSFDTQAPMVPVPQAIPVVHESLATISDRMGKVTQALVLIASVAPDTYTLLSRCVDYTVNLLAHIHNLEIYAPTATTDDVYRISTGVRHIIHQWTLCHTAGLISDMNHQVVIRELESIDQFVREKLITYCIGQVTYPFRIPDHASGNYHPEHITLENYFSSESVVPDKRSSSPKIDTHHKGQSSKTSKELPEPKPEPKVAPKSIFEPVTPQKIVSEYGSVPKIEPPTEQYQKQLSTVQPISGEDKKERRDAIMRTIRSKGQVTIKDISENIKDISEKTIQRDLQELIQHGVLIREGEKRWAVYKLAMKNV
jgi:DNA-binding transcriptional ArsR family regulator